MRQAAAQEHRTIRNRYQARLCPNEQGKKLKSEQAYPKPPHLPWQLHPGGGNCYLARASRANTTCGCLRPEPRVHYGLHPAYCYPIFFFLFILFRYSVIDSYPYLLTTFVVMQQVSRHTWRMSSVLCGVKMLIDHMPNPEKHAHIDIGMLQPPYYSVQPPLLVQRSTCTTRCL